MLNFGVLWNRASFKFEKWNLWNAQLKLVQDLDTFKINWVAKQRQLGVSMIAGRKCLFTCISEPNAECIIISKDITEAKEFLRNKVLLGIQHLYNTQYAEGQVYPFPEFEKGDIKLVWENGSRIEVASSDNEEIRSRTPRLIIFDEIRTFGDNDAKELWTAILPSIVEQEKSQLMCISTSKFGSWFNVTTDKILNGKIEGVNLVSMFENSNPARTKEWEEREKKRLGDEILFYREYPRNWDDFFASREGAVWKDFDNRVGGRHVNYFEPKFERNQYYIVYDHGMQHPVAVIFCIYDKYNDHLYIFDELYIKGKELPEVTYMLREKMNFFKLKYAAPTKPYKAIADRQCFAQDGRETVSNILNRLTGIFFCPCDKKNLELARAKVGLRMANNGLTVHPRCEKTIEQVKNWKWKNDPDETKAEKPVDKADDICFEEKTLISTIDGQKEINKIKKGDLVLSHLGCCRAETDAYCTGIKEVVKVEFDKNNTIICTPNHKFLLYSGYSIISENDKCQVKTDTLKSTIRDTSILTEIDTTKTLLGIGDELTQAVNLGLEKCITTFGAFITENSITPNLLSITKIATKLITTYLTSRNSHFLITNLNINRIKLNEWLDHRINAELIISLLKEDYKQALLSRQIGKKINIDLKKQFVLSAGKSLRSTSFAKNEKTQNTYAPIIAEPQNEDALDWIILKCLVSYAVSYLSKTNIARLLAVRPLALKRCGVIKRNYAKLPVFNFKTEHGTYCANGVIVSNCDDLCYLENELNSAVRTINQPEKGLLEQYFDRMKGYSFNEYMANKPVNMEDLNKWQGL